ncbi:hypothetical protein [Nonomuraea sp. NPDC001699]
MGGGVAWLALTVTALAAMIVAVTKAYQDVAWRRARAEEQADG